MDPVTAMCVNVPSALADWLLSFDDDSTLLIHLSTDHVYEGVKKEEDDTAPVNVYGRSKVESEHFISANWANFAILRSSISYGPQTAAPVRKSLPVQWLDSLLAKGREVEFCRDEFRCPIFIKDVVTIIQTLTSRWMSDQEDGIEDCIQRLPKYKFQRCEKQNGDSPNEEIQESPCGKMTECNTNMPTEHVIALEDAVCCICLCTYEEGKVLRRLPCRHHFHSASIMQSQYIQLW